MTGRKPLQILHLEPKLLAAMSVMSGINKALAALRGDCVPEVTRAELARRLRVAQNRINEIEDGASWPNAKTIDRVLVALGRDVHDLADALDRVNGRPRKAFGYEVRTDDDEATIGAKLAQRVMAFEDLLERRFEEMERRVEKRLSLIESKPDD